MANKFAAVLVCCFLSVCAHGQLSVANTYSPGDMVKVTVTFEHPFVLKNGFLRFQGQSDMSAQFGSGTIGSNDNYFERQSDTQYVIGQKVPDIPSGTYQLIFIDGSNTGIGHDIHLQHSDDVPILTVQINNPNKSPLGAMRNAVVEQKK